MFEPRVSLIRLGRPGGPEPGRGASERDEPGTPDPIISGDPERRPPEPAGGGADLARRRFFRQFAGDVMEAAATVVGAAGVIQRTSAEAATALLDPVEPAAGPGYDPVTGSLVRPAVFGSPFRLAERALLLVDQRRLPDEVVELECATVAEVAFAIRERVVRGAPAIGQVSALALALAARSMVEAGAPTRRAALLSAAHALVNARPSSITIRRAVERMLARYEALGGPDEDGSTVASELRRVADAIVLESSAAHTAIVALGLGVLPDTAGRPLRVLTLGNSGVLACGRVGTALGVVTAAAAAGRDVRVLVCETRPLLQGARLTAWELADHGITRTLIADASAGARIAKGEVDVVLVAADRVAANGDFVGVIGTYPLAVLAARHGVPLVVCAPLATFDPVTVGGEDLPVDAREAAGMILPGPTGRPPADGRMGDPADELAPVGDVTPADLVSAIVTEAGVLRAPFGPALAAAFEAAARSGTSLQR
jgi:methylthioribose-1-phosphate isomerase